MDTKVVVWIGSFSILLWTCAVRAELIGHWTLDETSGTVAVDSSGMEHHGIYVNSPDLGVAGIFGTGMDSTGGYMEVDLDDDLPVQAEERTIAFWMTTPMVQSDRKFCSYGAASAGVAFTFCLENVNGEDGVRMRHWGGNMFYPGFVLGEWNHVAIRVPSGAAIVNDTEVVIDGVNIPGYRSGGSDQTLATAASPFRVGTSLADQVGQVFEGAFDDVYFFDHALTDEEILMVMAGQPKELASAPVPEDGATDVLRDTDLSWTPGEYAATHDVYLGMVFEDVNDASRANPMDVLLSQGQSSATYDPGRLAFGQTYYWRIDEVNAAPDGTVFKGDLWSFTTEPVAYPIEEVTAMSNATSEAMAGPENTVNGSGLNAADQHSTKAADMWLGSPTGADPVYIQYDFGRVYKLHEMLVWNYNVQFEPVLGFGLKGVAVEYSVNGTDWAVLGDVEFAQATATDTYAANTTVDLGGVAAQYVRLTINSGWGMIGQYGLSEVRFLYIPTIAREPAPGDGATGLDPATTLSWRAGREAGTHEIYLGTDPNALPLVDAVGDASYDADLGFGRTYHWQIVEVNEAEAPSAWAGDVWSFSTLEYALIEGFETYDDDIDAGTTIFDTWIDGWVNETGSTVGYFDAPFAEKTIVRSGGQSMPLQYDNSQSPFYSETERIFDSAQDWTVHGADTLVVYFQGVPGPFAELPSGKIVLGAAGTDIWNTTDECRLVYKPLSGDGSIVAYVESVANTNAWAKGGVMIRETLDAGSTFAAVYSTPGNGCRYQARLETDVAAVSDTSVATPEQIALSAPHWVKIERVGNAFNGYYSTDGENWTSMSWNPQTIAMGSDVYIGLVLTSHAAGVLGSAEFSDVATTGNVSGPWTVATIGPEQPEGNALSPLYVTLEDAAGKSATVSHPAGDAAVILGGWNEWAIPMSEFAGVNLSRVEVMRIGVGNASSPSAGGTGIVYFDDIGFGRSAANGN